MLALVVVTVVVVPIQPLAGQVPDAGIDPASLVSEQALRSWQVQGLQPAVESSLPDWDVQVWAFAELNGVMYVGGRFQTVRRGAGATEYDQPFLAAFEVATGQWVSSFRPVLDDGVYALAASADGSRLLVGGEFSSVNGVPGTAGLAALNPVTGEPDTSWVASISRTGGEAVVMDITVTSDAVYVGGAFSRITQRGGTEVRRFNLARLDPATGDVDRGFDVPVTGGRVMAMDLTEDESQLYVSGFLRNIDLVPDTSWLGMIDTATGEVFAMADPLPADGKNWIFDLVVTDSEVWAAAERHHLYVYGLGDRALKRDFRTSGHGGDYQALFHHDGLVWAGGHFHGWERDVVNPPHWDVRTAPLSTWYRQVSWLTTYNADNGAPVDGWIARMGARDGVFAITVDSEGKVWAGGDPTSSGTVPVGGFAVYPPRTADDEVNVARGGTATQSSTAAISGVYEDDRRVSEERCNLGGYMFVNPPASAVDGKVNGGPVECSFSATEAELTPWWQVDMGAEQEVDAVRIWNLYSFAGSVDLADVWIAVSNDLDAINSTDPDALTADPDVTVVKMEGVMPWFREIPVGAHGRYVRVFMNSDTPTHLRLPEVEVLDLPGVTPPRPVDPDNLLVPPGSDWRYADDGIAQPDGWNTVGFADDAWSQGSGLLGFGDSNVVTETAGGTVTTYFRHDFTVNDPASIPGLTLDLLADDGAVVYLNGTEVGRVGMPLGAVSHDTESSESLWGAAERVRTSLPIAAAGLRSGTNVLAVEVHNNWRDGGDLAFDAGLSVTDQPVVAPTLDQVLVPFEATWRYLDTGADPGDGWAASGFDDRSWPSGQAQLGYGDGDESTVISEGPVPNRHIAYYFRRSFDVDDLASLKQLEMSLLRDDGAVVYINGTEVARSNMPEGPINSSTLAEEFAFGSGEVSPHRLVVDTSVLREGSNSVAVEVHSAEQGSRDVSFDLQIIGLAN